MKPIKKEYLGDLRKEIEEDKTLKLTRHALAKNDITSIAYSQDDIKETDFNFSIDIKTLPVTNQKASGRCWIFAATNVLREIIAKELNLANFELSQSYIAFYDKLEKINLTLEIILELIDKDYDDRTLQFILHNGVGDGGQWDMFVSVVKKYGLMPKNVFPETFTSSNTRSLNSLINTELKIFAYKAQILYKAGAMEDARKEKEELLDKFYKALISCYGLPPETFSFEYVDKDNVYHKEDNLTAMTFFEKYIGNRLDDYVSIINAPTKTKPFMKAYHVKYLGNVVGGKEVTHLNLPINRLKELVISQLKDGEIVWFGSDVAFYRDNDLTAWDDTRFDYETLFGLDYYAPKGESLDYAISQMNHAMCITGVNLVNNKPTKWKIENSWGKKEPFAGYYLASDSWFDRYTFQAVVHKKYLTKEELDAYKGEAIELKPWDPMGSLAD